MLAEVIEEFDDTGLIIRMITAGFTGLDVKMFLTYEDTKALIETLEGALKRMEETHEQWREDYDRGPDDTDRVHMPSDRSNLRFGEGFDEGHERWTTPSFRFRI